MDRTPSSIGRKLQNYLDTLDFSPHLKEVKTPTLLLVEEESPTSILEQQQFMAGELPNCRLEVYSGLGHGLNVIHLEWCVQRGRPEPPRILPEGLRRGLWQEATWTRWERAGRSGSR